MNENKQPEHDSIGAEKLSKPKEPTLREAAKKCTSLMHDDDRIREDGLLAVNREAMLELNQALGRDDVHAKAREELRMAGIVVVEQWQEEGVTQSALQRLHAVIYGEPGKKSALPGKEGGS